MKMQWLKLFSRLILIDNFRSEHIIQAHTAMNVCKVMEALPEWSSFS